MRIGVDCRLSGPQHAGIGRYIYNLIARLPSLDPNSTWIFFTATPDQIPDFSHLSNVEVISAPIKHYSLAEQLQLPAIFNASHLDLLHVPHFNVPIRYQGKLVITIHDLLWHEYRGTTVTTLPRSIYWLKYLGYKFVANHALHQAAKIFVPAQVIKDTIASYFPEAERKTMVTKEGVSAEFAKTSQTKFDYTAPKNRKILLYVGSLYPHKNVSLVIKALPQLPEYQLVLVGARNVFQDQVRNFAHESLVSDQVSSLGFVKDAELVSLMHQAWALVQPSLSEGFGLTGIEAMAAGVPVIASQIPIFQEIYGQAANYFDPQSVKSFVETVTHLSSTQRQAQVKLGHQQVKKYSWDHMAEQTLAAYHQVIGS